MYTGAKKKGRRLLEAIIRANTVLMPEKEDFNKSFVFLPYLTAAQVNQSPIDIISKHAKGIDLGPLEFGQDEGKSDKLGAAVVLRNDGKGFSVSR